jgi:hypothetical protein
MLRQRVSSANPPPAFIHPLGFVHLELERDGSSTLRLHIWFGRDLIYVKIYRYHLFTHIFGAWKV